MNDVKSSSGDALFIFFRYTLSSYYNITDLVAVLIIICIFKNKVI